MSKPRQLTRTTSQIILSLSNTLAILDIRFLALRGGQHAKLGKRLVSSLPPKWSDLLTRPSSHLHENRFPDAVLLLRMQLAATTGKLDPGDQLVYLMMSGGQPYVGKAKGTRHNSTNALGMLSRWSEHVRELYRQSQGLVPALRQRRRYKELVGHHAVNCLNCLVLEITNDTSINAAEAKSIALVRPNANGAELCHFSENFRRSPAKPRGPGRPPRKRFSRSTRRRAREAHLTSNSNFWGADVNEHSQSIKAASACNIVAKFERYTGKNKKK